MALFGEVNKTYKGLCEHTNTSTLSPMTATGTNSKSYSLVFDIHRTSFVENALFYENEQRDPPVYQLETTDDTLVSSERKTTRLYRFVGPGHPLDLVGEISLRGMGRDVVSSGTRDVKPSSKAYSLGLRSRVSLFSFNNASVCSA